MQGLGQVVALSHFWCRRALRVNFAALCTFALPSAAEKTHARVIVGSFPLACREHVPWWYGLVVLPIACCLLVRLGFCSFVGALVCWHSWVEHGLRA